MEPSTQNDIGERLIKEGYVLANRNIKNPRVRSLVGFVFDLIQVGLSTDRFVSLQKNTYADAEAVAKKGHAGIWEYGDVGLDDAPEFGSKK